MPDKAQKRGLLTSATGDAQPFLPQVNSADTWPDRLSASPRPISPLCIISRRALSKIPKIKERPRSLTRVSRFDSIAPSQRIEVVYSRTELKSGAFLAFLRLLDVFVWVVWPALSGSNPVRILL